MASGTGVRQQGNGANGIMMAWEAARAQMTSPFTR